MQQLSFEINGVTTPMDVLLTLIAKHKLNIYDIAISQLLEQYLNYLADCQEQDLELAGAFLEMAARLIYLKTAALLPKPQEAQADKEDLQESLLLYARCKQAAAILAGRYKEQQPFCRQPMPLPEPQKTYLRTYPAEVLRSSFLSIGKKQLPALQGCHAGEITASGQPENRFGLLENCLADAKGFPCGNSFPCHAL